ncbi:very short patch repair endonuclease [Thermophilibacter sp.]|uniref:very short patch repair endonuclease n=1 Tax=Thermophilibacter sp. TaxID=2847309 RepID=UPI003A921490
MVARARVPEASSEATRHVMQANRSKNTGPELAVRAALRAAGLTGYRLHWKKAPGKPDVCFPGRRVAIFIHGCFWHRCPHCAPSRPKTHAQFWEEKFARNRARDRRDVEQLLAAGWTVLVVWECQLKRGRAEATMARVVTQARRASERRLPAHVLDAGAPPVWRLRAARARRRARRR